MKVHLDPQTMFVLISQVLLQISVGSLTAVKYWSKER